VKEELKLSALKTALDQEGVVRGDEVIFFCPPAPLGHGNPRNRSHGQLSVNLKTDWFHCWSCGLKGRNLYRLLTARGKTKVSREYLEEMEEKRRTGREVEKKEKVYDTPVLPPEFKSLSTPSKSPYYRAALTYLAQRGLVTDDVLRWKLGYCEDGELAGRIVIPSFDEHGLLNFVVGRSFYDDGLRYKPYPKHLCKDVVWNDYMLDWAGSIDVTEGPFDAFVVRDNVTILQGTNMPESLVRKIVLSGVDVYFAMDADAFRRQLEYIDLFLSYGVVCRYVDVRGARKKDVGSMTRERYGSLRREARQIRNELDILKMRVMA
jgi:hypothetical protein